MTQDMLYFSSLLQLYDIQLVGSLSYQPVLNLAICAMCLICLFLPPFLQWFGFYRSGQDKETIPLQETTLYTQVMGRGEALSFKAPDS